MTEDWETLKADVEHETGMRSIKKGRQFEERSLTPTAILLAVCLLAAEMGVAIIPSFLLELQLVAALNSQPKSQIPGEG